MKTLFTPGPWALSTVNFELVASDSAACIYKDTRFPTGEVGSAPIAEISRAIGDGSAKANATLISAAPDLFNALLTIFQSPRGEGLHVETVIQMYEALEKAAPGILSIEN